MHNTPDRRDFLNHSALTAMGAAAGLYLGSSESIAQQPPAQPQVGGAEKRLEELGIKLLAPTPPSATLVPAVLVGNLLFVSGHIPRDPSGERIVGKVGSQPGQMSTEKASQAARLVGLAVLSSAQAALGSLDRIVRVVKVLGMVNAYPDFTEHPQVINGFSELMIQVFGEAAGKGARSAVGMSSLPGGVPVEVEAIFQVRM